MAQLDYLTTNSLTAYPFKPKGTASPSNAHAIQDDWFYDFLLVSYAADLRSVYISRIVKTAGGQVTITLANAETLSDLPETIILPSIVNNYANNTIPFYSSSCDRYAAKIVFGPGLVSASAFDQTYTVHEAELSTGAVILKMPAVRKLIFDTHGAAGIETVLESTAPIVRMRYNTQFTLEALNAGGLYVGRLLGEGLYDPCTPIGDVTDLLSLNNVVPDAFGRFFLNVSSCYTNNMLTSNDVSLFGDLLAPYNNFEIHTGETTSAEDVVSVNHSLVLQNFCSPKCPPENMGAFMYYMNRVTDGAEELARIVTNQTATRGRCTVSVDGTTITATAFSEESTVFGSCLAPGDEPAFTISYGTKFEKYYHEGKKISVAHNAAQSITYVILEVVSETQVRVLEVPGSPEITDSSSSYTSPFPFEIRDVGIISGLNCAIINYNESSADNLSPYYIFKYTTTDAYNIAGIYATFYLITVAIFNPSRQDASFVVDFDVSEESVYQIGATKVRTEGGLVDSNAVTLPCHGYAFIEAVFNLECAEEYGYILSTVKQVEDGEDDIVVGEPYLLDNLSGPLDCVSNSAPRVVEFITEDQAFTSEVIDAPPGTTYYLTRGNVPDWLTITANAEKTSVTLTAPAQSDPASRIYNIVVVFTTGTATIPMPVQLIYIAKPIILTPITDAATPIVVKASVEYILSSPALKVIAKNITPKGTADAGLYYYYSSSATPAGLTFSIAETDLNDNGKLIGQLHPDTVSANVTLTITATNPAGSDSKVIHLQLVANTPPVLKFEAKTAPTSGDIGDVNATITFYPDKSVTYDKITAPIAKVLATNPPQYSYSTGGTFPPGVSFSTASQTFYGKVHPTAVGSYAFTVKSTNIAGDSNILNGIMDVGANELPVLKFESKTSPHTGDIGNIAETITFSLDKDVTYDKITSPITKLAATHGPQYGYAINGTLPSGVSFSPEHQTFYGKVHAGAIGATNFTARSFNVGGTSNVLNGIMDVGGNVLPVLMFEAKTAPYSGDMADIAETITFNLNKAVTYDKVATPIVKVTASNGPQITYIPTGTLPPGILFSIEDQTFYGKVHASVSGAYAFSIKCINAGGTSNILQGVMNAGSANLPALLFTEEAASFTGNINDSGEVITFYVDKDTVYDKITSPITKLQASNGPQLSYVITGELPPGLMFNAAAQAFYGKLSTYATGGEFPFTAKTINAAGSSNVLQGIMHVGTNNPPVLMFDAKEASYTGDMSNIAETITFNLNKAVTYNKVTTPIVKVVATNGPQISYISGGILPPGISFSQEHQTFHGKASVSSAGEYPFTIKSVNVGGDSNVLNGVMSISTDSLPVLMFEAKTAPYTGDMDDIDDTIVFTLNKAVTYNKVTTPIVKVVATNGPQISYTPSGTLPSGISFSQEYQTFYGKITGNIHGTYSFTIKSINAVGASNVLTGSMIVAATPPPELQFIAGAAEYTGDIDDPAEEIAFKVSSLITYDTIISPICGVSITNDPQLAISVVGALPTGITFNASQRVFSGRSTRAATGSYPFTVKSVNLGGNSNVLQGTMNYTKYAAPVISTPTTGLVTVVNYLANVTGLTVSASDAFGGEPSSPAPTGSAANVYNASGLPPGVTINSTTGAITGTIGDAAIPQKMSGSYPLSYNKTYSYMASASNPMGTVTRQASIKLYRTELPIITYPRADYVKWIVLGQTYTTNSPVISFSATNTPTSFSVTGSPAGLTVSGSKLVGTVSFASPPTPGVKAVAVTAYNPRASTPVTFYIGVPLKLVVPNLTASFTQGTPALGTEVTASTNAPPGEYTLTPSGVPPGMTFSAGALTGTPTSAGVFTLRISASSTEYGRASAIPVVITIIPTPPPIVKFVAREAAYTGDIADVAEEITFEVSSLVTYDASTSPVCEVNITGDPQYSVTITGDLPAGMEFDTVRRVFFGRVWQIPTGDFPFTIKSVNLGGASNVLAGVFSYTKYAKPIISTPTVGQVNRFIYPNAVTGLTISASDAFGGQPSVPAPTGVDANYYSTRGLPSGMSVHSATGVVSGYVTDAAIPQKMSTAGPITYSKTYGYSAQATNPMGTDSHPASMTLIRYERPIITYPEADYLVWIVLGNTYNVDHPVMQFRATNYPTGFYLTNKPTGLYISGSKLIGTVSFASPPSPGKKAMMLTADNINGDMSIARRVYVGIPQKLTAGSTYVTLTKGVALAGTEVTVTTNAPAYTYTFVVSGLPTGTSFSSGALQGTPTKVGLYTLRVAATSTEYGNGAFVTITINVVAP